MARIIGIVLGVASICAVTACTKSRVDMTNVAGATTVDCGRDRGDCAAQAALACPSGYDVASQVDHKSHRSMAIRCR